jgi:hypothetical protein
MCELCAHAGHVQDLAPLKLHLKAELRFLPYWTAADNSRGMFHPG